MNNTVHWKVEFHDTLLSTNDYCKEQAEKHPNVNRVVCAKKQVKARGSRGRSWIEPEGNLALSFLYWPQNFSIQKQCWIPFIASLALYDTILPLCKNDLVIKWPNDLLYDQKKIAGILIENSIDAPQTLRWIVIGLGVNINQAPALNEKQTACVKDFTDNPPSIEALTKTIQNHLSKWLQYLINDGEPFIRRTWLKHSMPIGTFIDVKTGNRILRGIYLGIDEKGNLLLKTQVSLEKLSVAEIF